jgi:GT2 family glycosyltransferase
MSQIVHAVVVTYNRRELLKECLRALEAQTRPLDRILVVDNASTDDTLAMLAAEFPHLPVVALDRNGGSAGGFRDGLKSAFDQGGADWFWLLDDDTIPEPRALEEMLLATEAAGEPPAMVSSNVFWSDGNPHPMNKPWPRYNPVELAVDAAERHLVLIRAATYVSILVRREALEAHGLPSAPMFIWGDDIEFTARLLRHERGYLAPRSVVEHRTAKALPASNSKGGRYFYDVRNKVWMLRGEAWDFREKVLFGWFGLKGIAEYMRFNGFAPGSFAVVVRGLVAGLRSPVPAVELPPALSAERVAVHREAP